MELTVTEEEVNQRRAAHTNKIEHHTGSCTCTREQEVSLTSVVEEVCCASCVHCGEKRDHRKKSREPVFPVNYGQTWTKGPQDDATATATPGFIFP
jgi:hypothetical protein